MAINPKGCHVRYVALDGRGNAEVRVGCGEQKFSKNVKARELNFRGSYVTGAARVDFVLAPAHATCAKSGARITCKLNGDTSQPSLQGFKLTDLWPFKKKPAKRHPMAKRIMYSRDSSGRLVNMLAGARRRRRKRR